MLVFLLLFGIPFLPNNENTRFKRLEGWLRAKGKYITYAMVVTYYQIISWTGIVAWIVFYIVHSTGLLYEQLESGDIWIWMNVFPLVCIMNLLYYRYVIKSNIVDVLVEEYKPVGFANSRYQNRLADFIHFGYYSDPKDGSEKFEVMNQLESAAVYRIRPKWNERDFLTDWSLIKGVPWQTRKADVMVKSFKK